MKQPQQQWQQGKVEQIDNSGRWLDNNGGNIN